MDTVESWEKQLKIKKGLPRGRPWPKGVSGNPAGRPRGARNKFTLSMMEGMEGVRRAEAEVAKPRRLDTSKPYESWDGYFIQDGLRFHKQTLEALPHDGPPPEPPERLNPRERRTPMVWNRRYLYLQNGWAFDPATRKAVKI